MEGLAWSHIRCNQVDTLLDQEGFQFVKLKTFIVKILRDCDNILLTEVNKQSFCMKKKKQKSQITRPRRT